MASMKIDSTFIDAMKIEDDANFSVSLQHQSLSEIPSSPP
jgi:hypothetical protein